MIGLILFPFRLLVLALAILAFGFVVFWWATPVPRLASDVQGQAIVVVTGGQGRIAAGLALLEAGRAPKLFISGVGQGAKVSEVVREAGGLAARPELAQCCIFLGYRATNTVENGAETAEWMAQNGVTDIILVSSNYHLRRAELEIRMAAPDVRVTPFVTDTAETRRWWEKPWTTRLMIEEYLKTLWAAGRYLSGKH